MTLKNAYDEGARKAWATFVLKNATGYNPTLNAAQSSATAMPSAVPKPVTPPTAPIASGASKANVLG